jgi:hypothetical protein
VRSKEHLSIKVPNHKPRRFRADYSLRPTQVSAVRDEIASILDKLAAEAGTHPLREQWFSCSFIASRVRRAESAVRVHLDQLIKDGYERREDRVRGGMKFLYRKTPID